MLRGRLCPNTLARGGPPAGQPPTPSFMLGGGRSRRDRVVRRNASGKRERRAEGRDPRPPVVALDQPTLDDAGAEAVGRLLRRGGRLRRRVPAALAVRTLRPG